MKIREIAKQLPLEEGATGKILSKVAPGVGAADAAYRAKEGDWLGAGIAGVATGLGLVPPVGPPGWAAQAGSYGLDAFNVLRDIAKEKGGWSNLGKDFMKAYKDAGIDQAGMGTMYESFAEFDRLEESGQLDEGLVWDAIKGAWKYGDDFIGWAKNLRKAKPEVPSAKPPLSAAEREALERAEEEAARRAEKEIKVIDRRGQPKQADEIPIVGKDAAPPSNVVLPKRKWHETDKAWLKRLDDLGPEYRAKYLSDLETLEKIPKSIPQQIGQKALDITGKTVAYPFKHPIKTAIGAASSAPLLGTGYYYMQDPDAGLGTAIGKTGRVGFDLGKGIISGFAGKSPAQLQQDIRNRAEKSDEYWGIDPKGSNVPPSDSGPEGSNKPEEPKAPVPYQRQTPFQGKAPEDKEKKLAERYQQFLNDAEEKPVYSKDQYIGWAKKYSEQYNVPLSMVLHAMFKETGWLGDPERMRTATSPTGARGVMQIQPQYAEKGAYKIKIKDLTDPEKNIEAGVRGLAYYYNKYKTPEKALAAYNAGEGGASTFLKTGDVNTLRTKETRNYIKGFKDNVIHQLEKFYPKNKDKVAQVATDVLATAVGAGNAQAADEVPTGMGGPETKGRQPTEAELAQMKKERQRIADINKRLARGEKFQDPVKELEKIIQQADAAGKTTEKQLKDLESLKAEYERERAKLGSKTVPPDDPNSTYINVGPVRLKVDGKLKSPKFPSIQTDIPSGDYQSQGDATPAKTATKKSSPVPKELPAVDDFGNVITPGKINKKAEKPADKSRSQQSVSGTIDRGSDAPNLAPQKSKSDSTLDKPAPGVSNQTVAPKSERPADTKAAQVSQGSDKGKGKADATAKADAETKVNVRKEFEKAFAQARAEKGPGQTFTFKDPRTNKEGTFTTDYADEVKSKVKASKAGVDDAITQIIKGKKVVPSAVTDTDTEQVWDPVTKTFKDIKSIDTLVKNRIDKELRKDVLPDYTVDIDPEALKVPYTPAAQPAVKVEPEKANVLRSTDGTPVISGTGLPWATGTSDKEDIERAKAELQKKIDDEKAKRDLEKISPDLSRQEPESFVDKWDRVIDTLTGNRRPPADRETIRVPESVNTELKDILWLAGRTKK